MKENKAKNIEMFNLLSYNFLQEIETLSVDPNQVITTIEIKTIIDEWNNFHVQGTLLKMGLESKEEVKDFKDSLIDLYKNISENEVDFSDLITFSDNEDIKKILKLNQPLTALRNEIINSKINEIFRINIPLMQDYINDFYLNFNNIHSDSFMEIEGALWYLEPYKHMMLKHIWQTQNVLESEFSKNVSSFIFIYSLFDKLSTLMLMFNYEKFSHEKNYYFRHMTTPEIMNVIKADHPELEKFLEETMIFMSQPLFIGFQKKRNDLAHNNTMPMEEYFTNLYVFVAFFLIIYYIQEVVIKHYKPKKE